MKRKPLKMALAAGLVFSLLIPSAVPALAVQPSEYEGYLVQLKEDCGVQTFSEKGEDGLLVVDTLAQARAIPEELVEFIEPNYMVELFDTQVPQAPNDPLYGAYQWNLDAIHAYSAARHELTGKGVKVGFVDSGVNGAHEDLNPEHIHGMDFIPAEQEEGGVDRDYTEDNTGHGTFVCGLVAAQTDNGIGLAGVAPDAELYVYRVFDQKTAATSEVVKAIEQAIADGCQIINLSLGSSKRSEAMERVIQKAQRAGIIVVAAVGNSGNSVLRYPAALDGVIGVGSVDQNLQRSAYSQYNESVDFTAPGGGVAGLGYTAPDAYRLDLTSPANQGTSFSTPLVTALAALMLSYDPDISTEGVCQLLRTTATDLGKPGYDTEYGYGLVNTEKMVQELRRTYTIQYQLNGGTLEAPVTSYKVTDDTIVLPIPKRGNDWFMGWYEHEDCSGEPVRTLPAGSVGDRTLYAAWQSEEQGKLPFDDVQSDDWFSSYVRYVFERGMMAGTGNRRFSPAYKTDRAMAVTMLYQMAGKPRVSGELTFEDVKPGEYYYTPVLWAVERGVAKGYSEKIFGPLDSITREQLALMLYSFAGKPPVDEAPMNYPDAAQISPYAVTAMRWAVANGILKGTDKGELLPNGVASRAETAVMFTAFSKLMNR